MFRDRITEKYDELSPSFRKLADFILEQQLDAAFMTATELAHRMAVDAATVVRFAQTLGYSGFREMIKEIQQVVKSELKASHSADTEAPNDAKLFRGLLENEKHNLSLAQTRLNEQANTILPTLLNAQRIWVLGQGNCAYLAALCASELREIGLPATSIGADPLEAAKNLKQIGNEDVIIGFSLTGMDLDVAGAVDFARQHQAKTIVFSASPVTAAALASETTVVCPGPTQVHVASFTGLAAMIVALAAAFSVRHPEQAATMKEGLQQSYNELLELQAQSASEVDLQELWRQF